MVKLQNVTKTFNPGKPNAFTALRGVTLSIAHRAVTVFKGPSGSGKTTLLTLVGCMAKPTSGRIFLDDRELSSLPERFLAEIRRKTFGFVFQGYHLIRGLTVLENVMLPAYPLGLRHSQIRKTAVEILERLQVAHKADSAVEILSGGEQQRTAIARALINDPAVIVADEPTAHLDTTLSVEFMEIVRGLRADGKTILIASHDPLVFESSAVDRVVELRDGRVLGEGRP